MNRNNSNKVSVIIPCYNQGHFLEKAIESVLAQTYANFEVVVVDDGSSDNTREVALKFSTVKYIYQENSGLSAARNTGIKNSTGDYLLFLDADDWLFSEALETNVNKLIQHPEVAFVSGAFERVFTDTGRVVEVIQDIKPDYYCHLLHHNFIGMIATVLFQRWVFNEFAFDTTLSACEDYDLYLKAARNYPITHHTKKIAAYRIHSSAMSADALLMLNMVLYVRNRHQSQIRTESERLSFKEGNRFCRSYYYNELYKQLRQKKVKASPKVLQAILFNKPKYIFRYMLDVLKLDPIKI